MVLVGFLCVFIGVFKCWWRLVGLCGCVVRIFCVVSVSSLVLFLFYGFVFWMVLFVCGIESEGVFGFLVFVCLGLVGLVVVVLW